SFDGAKERAMHHHRTMRLVVFRGVLKFKSLRQIKVILHRAELPKTTNSIFDLEIDFGTVESGLAFDTLILNLTGLKSCRQNGFSCNPIVLIPKPLLGGVASLHGQFKLELLETERLQDLVSEIHAIVDFFANLLGRAKQVSVVDRETTHA